MKKLTKCNNVVITSLIVIGTFIVFFYLYVYGSNSEGFNSIGSSPSIGDKISEIKSKHNNNITYPEKDIPTNGKFHSCGVLTDYGQQACNNGVTMENIRCKWNSSPTTYSGSSIQMSTGGECVTI